MFNPFFRNPSFCGDFAPEAVPVTRADNRPRVHLWPADRGFRWSYGPQPRPTPPQLSAGAALDRALADLGQQGRRGVVVIVEPVLAHAGSDPCD